MCAIILPQRQTASKQNIAKINFEAQSRKILKLSKLDLKNEIAKRSLHSEETYHRVQSCLFLVNTVVKYPTNIAKFPTKITMKPAEQHYFPWEARIIILWRSRFFLENLRTLPLNLMNPWYLQTRRWFYRCNVTIFMKRSLLAFSKCETRYRMDLFLCITNLASYFKHHF